jgi:hypothetical protein
MICLNLERLPVKAVPLGELYIPGQGRFGETHPVREADQFGDFLCQFIRLDKKLDVKTLTHPFGAALQY